MAEQNTWLYLENNFELFLDPDGDEPDYYEFEVNPLKTIWEITLPKPYSAGGVAIDPTNLPGLRYAVHIDGTLNDPTDTDTGWSVELALPWTDLAPVQRRPDPAGTGGRVADEPDADASGTTRSWTASTARAREQDFWVWSPQYVVDMHKPEQWGVLGVPLTPHTSLTPPAEARFRAKVTMSHVTEDLRARRAVHLLDLVGRADPYLRGPDQLRWATLLRRRGRHLRPGDQLVRRARPGRRASARRGVVDVLVDARAPG